MSITDFLPCLWACLACVGYGLVYNIHGFGVLICGSGAALGWYIFLIMQHCIGGDCAPAFIAASVIALYAESMARVRHCPVTGYLQIALLPLVPGAGIYEAMRHCIVGDLELFFVTLIHTFSFAAALALGAMLTSTLIRIVSTLKN